MKVKSKLEDEFEEYLIHDIEEESEPVAWE
jgi:hypothetical protein